MESKKGVRGYRLVTTTLLGLAFGIACMLLSKFTAGIGYWPGGIALLLHHTAMGFAIGASALKMNWATHGALWGAVFGLFLAVIFVGGALQPWQAFIMPVIWGFLIETLTTKAFKQTREELRETPLAMPK